MEEQIYEGLPTASFLPVVNAKFKIVDEISIVVSRRGTYHEINPTVFDKDAGDFDIMKDNVLYMPSITKILLAENKYPQLKGNQIFTPYVLIFKEDTVEIQGNIIEILQIKQ